VTRPRLRALFGRPICARESTDADKLLNRGAGRVWLARDGVAAASGGHRMREGDQES
jgi:hypothetical protein